MKFSFAVFHCGKSRLKKLEKRNTLLEITFNDFK